MTLLEVAPSEQPRNLVILGPRNSGPRRFGFDIAAKAGRELAEEVEARLPFPLSPHVLCLSIDNMGRCPHQCFLAIEE